MERRYPTRNGIAVPPHELDLPPSELDLGRFENFNTHHWEFTRRAMGQFAITQTLRDLERLQSSLPKDVHQELHRRFDAPVFPTAYQAASEIMDAHEQGENVRIYNIERKQYELYPIPTSTIDEIKQSWGDIYKPREVIL